jgi:anaerobic ribonucleoside-triphosphate reductase
MSKENLCPCCEQHAFYEKDSYEICPVCNWEDDPVQSRKPDFPGGANLMSLNEAREAFKQGKRVQ